MTSKSIDNENDIVLLEESCNINETNTKGKLEKSIGVVGGVGIIIGTIIGSGIFITPSSILEYSGSVGMSLIVWAGCGIISCLGGVVFADLGASIPKSGGEYNYMLDVINPFVAFLFLWASVMVIKPASVTIIALTCGIYLITPFKTIIDYPEDLIKYVSALIILIVTIINIFSVRFAIKLNNYINYSKFVCIAIILGIGIAGFCYGGHVHFKDSFNGSSNFTSIGLAFYQGLWAYDGWNSLNYAAEEMRNPVRDLPLAVIIGMIFIGFIYIIINIAYIAAIGPEGVLSSNAVALTLGEYYLKKFSPIIPILVALSTFGTANCTLFGNGRLLFVAGREGHLPSLISAVHNKFKTPIPSLLFTSFISLLMLIPNSNKLDQMIGFFNFSSWLFFCICFGIHSYIRFKRPDIPLRLNVHPICSIFMFAISIVLVIIPFIRDWKGALIALGIILSGVPVYLIFIYDLLKIMRFIKPINEKLTVFLMKVYDLSPATREEDLDG